MKNNLIFSERQQQEKSFITRTPTEMITRRRKGKKSVKKD